MKTTLIAALALGLGISAGAASGQVNQPTAPSPAAPRPAMGAMGSMPMMHHATGPGDMGGMHHAMMGHTNGMPTASGQAAFGAIQEIVRSLQSDPTTNWSKVDIDALRQHLIDMDEVTLRADAQKEPIENGLRIMVTGTGRTLEAIQRMLPAHAQDINGLHGWSVEAKALPNGEALSVTGKNEADVREIRALGFMGIMVLGTHQMHHLAMAKGEGMHMH